MIRIIIAIVAGYAVNALLIAGAEQLLPMLVIDTKYFIADVVTQSLIQVLSGYVCSLIARPKQRLATVGLILLGLLVGIVSVIGSWHREPHWYAIALLLVYSPCVWIGYQVELRSQG